MLCESSRHPDHLDIALGSIDGEIDRLPSLHVHVDDRASFVDIHDDLPKLGGKTGTEPKGR